jgi:hypothetical protein
MVITNTISIRYLKTIGIVNNGFNGRGFANPYDVAIGPEGNIFVLNRCDPARRNAIRVGVCNLDEEYLYEFGFVDRSYKLFQRNQCLYPPDR